MVKALYTVDLEELYSSELKLSRKIIERFISIGIEKILRITKRNPLTYEIIQYNGKPIMEIIGGGRLYGCEQARVLYELGIRKFPMIFSESNYLCDISPYYIPVKVKDALLLDVEEYKKFCKKLDDLELDYC